MFLLLSAKLFLNISLSFNEPRLACWVLDLYFLGLGKSGWKRCVVKLRLSAAQKHEERPKDIAAGDDRHLEPYAGTK